MSDTVEQRTMTAASRIACPLDFDRPGKQITYLPVAHSDNRHAYGVIPVPIAQIANGTGPTALLTAGNHGDEYEGQILLRRLLRDLDPAEVSGRIIIMPALNYPAALSGTRVSPIDQGNMNRAFPGHAAATPTFAIAHFVETVLLPQCDFALDLHSGGAASEFLPCAFLCRRGNAELMAKKLAACEAFAAPVTVVVGTTSDDRSLSTAADRHGVVNIATELAGAASVDRHALDIANAGISRLLVHWGLLSAQPVDRPQGETRYLMPQDRDDFIMAPIDGIFEPYCRLGDVVESGRAAGAVHPMDDLERLPRRIEFRRSGTIVCRRVPAPVCRGDYLFHLGREVGRDALLHGSQDAQS